MGRQALESSVSGAVLEARTWLAHAAESDDPYVMKHVAWLLATAPEDSVRDPETALRLAERLDATRSINPELSLVLAAALAANGKLVEAREAAAAAVKKAEKLGWDTAALYADLQQYVDGCSPAPRELVASAEKLNLLRDGAM